MIFKIICFIVVPCRLMASLCDLEKHAFLLCCGQCLPKCRKLCLPCDRCLLTFDAQTVEPPSALLTVLCETRILLQPREGTTVGLVQCYSH